MFKHDTSTITDTELKRFGLIFGPLAMAVSIWQATKGHWIHVCFFTPAGVYAFVCALINPRWVFPLRKALETVFKMFMEIVTKAVLILCFYLVFTPMGLIMRLLKKDLLNRTLDADASTYWVDRKHETFDSQHYKKQF